MHFLRYCGFPRVLLPNMSISKRALVMSGHYFALNVPDLISFAIYIKIELYLRRKNNSIESIELPELDQPYGGIYVGDQASSDNERQSPQQPPASGWFFFYYIFLLFLLFFFAAAHGPSQKEVRAILIALRTYATTCFLDAAVALVQLFQSSTFAISTV